MKKQGPSWVLHWARTVVAAFALSAVGLHAQSYSAQQPDGERARSRSQPGRPIVELITADTGGCGSATGTL
jgi:hypothetical protein